jgi:transposase
MQLFSAIKLPFYSLNYYGFGFFLHPMTKIKSEDKIRIVALRDSGMGYKAIADQLGFNKSTVAMHCQAIDAIAGLPPKEKQYRGKIKSRDQLAIKQFILANPLSPLEDILNACNLEVALSTLHEYLKTHGLPARKAKSRIVISDINRRKRIAFCKLMLTKSDEYLASIIFSDETIVKSRPNGEVVFYRAPEGTEFYQASNASSGSSVMFWGCVSLKAYGPLVEVKGKNTALSYIETLKTYLLPELEAAEVPMVFQQDNASIHKTAAVMSFMTENGILTFEWPPQSPDLSPIENLWNVMKMKMKALTPRPRSHASMRDACLEIWRVLADDIRVSLVSGFRKRLEKCLKFKGDIIKFK